MSSELKKIMEECADIYKEQQLKHNINQLIKQNQYILSDSVIEDKKLKIIKENIKYYLDYQKKNVDISSEYGYKGILINLKDGLTKDIVLNILTNICLNISNVYIIINCNKIITKKKLEIIDEDIDLINDTKDIYEEGKDIYEEIKDIYKEKDIEDKSKTYSLIRKNIPKYLNELSKKKAKIFIISLTSKVKIKKIFEYYDIDKYISKYFTSDMCTIKTENNQEKMRELLDKINEYVNKNELVEKKKYNLVENEDK